MIAMQASVVARATGGKLVAGSRRALATSVAIDSREVRPGAAFIAFPGERVDGHAFAQEALSRGARVLVLTRDDPEAAAVVEADPRHELALVRVDDATAAVQALAMRHREHLTCPVIGVTGSSGKTTTKDLLRAVLATRLSVVATEGNRNNEIGVPLTLLEAGPATGAVVLEMAMRGHGQIARLCEIGRPTVGLVTNVGQTHIELLGSEQAIASAKAELVRAVPAAGRVFLNGDDEWSRMMEDVAEAPATYYGTAEGVDVRARDVETDPDGRPSFTLDTSSGSVAVALAFPGRHNAYNAAAAAAVGLHLGITLEEIGRGLSEARPSSMRMEVFESAGGVTVINDAYNANPTAMRAALRTLADVESGGRRVAVLGDMAELGSLSELAHFGLGEYAASLPIDRLVVVGEGAGRIADGAVRAGMAETSIVRCATSDEAAEAVGELLLPGDVVLLKASRIMGLERVVEGIINPHV